jgi:tetratricopeptide (TPR) repeat protein
VLRPGEAAFGRLVERFLGEARHLARLRHPNIVSVHEIGRAGGEPYFTMDYVDGEPLSAVLERGPLSPARALAVLRQAAEGVRHAHAQGIIHRDLKPGNILLDPQGRAYVTDFGLARDMTATSKLMQSGEVMGTPAYMAPEQALGQGELIGEATDIHALGVVLYEMLTGRPPYGCDAPATVLVRLLKEEPVPPRYIDRRIPRDLETICLKALAKQPERRYPAVGALLEDLRRFEVGQPTQARRPGLLARAGRRLRRHVKPIAAVLLAAALAVFGMPRLFDRKTAEQLVAVADEQRQAGEYQAAIRVYRRALGKATGEQRRDILRKMLACCDEIRDDKSALDACLLVLETDPDVSFGKYDYLVAQAVVTQIRAHDVNLSLRYAKDRPLLRLAQRRLEIFLDGGGGTPDQRKEAEETRAVIRKALNKEAFQSPSYTPQPELPTGTPEELRRQARDPKAMRWERGKAAYAAGQEMEKAGDTKAALEAYRQAFDLMRPVYPTSEGASNSIPWHPATPPVPECALLRKVVTAWRRLDPAAPDVLRGGLRLRLEGIDLPADLDLGLRVVLYAPAVPGAAQEANRSLTRTAPVRPDRTIRLGVADGRYHISLSKASWAYTTEAARRVGTLLELDAPSPPEVEIRGTVVDVPVHCRLVQEITALEPADGASFDLQRDIFRWTAVAGARSYRVNFGYREDSLQSSTVNGLPCVTASSAGVCLGTLPPKEVPSYLRDRLVPGRTGTWSVEAFDAAGRKVGAMVQSNHPFLVARGLGQQ